MNSHTERFYEIAAREVANKEVVQGLMAKAFADNNGDEKSTIATYIRLRVSQMEEHYQRDLEIEKQIRHTEAQRQIELAKPPSLMRLLGRFSARHPFIIWIFVIGAIMLAARLLMLFTEAGGAVR